MRSCFFGQVENEAEASKFSYLDECIFLGINTAGYPKLLTDWPEESLSSRSELASAFELMSSSMAAFNASFKDINAETLALYLEVVLPPHFTSIRTDLTCIGLIRSIMERENLEKDIEIDTFRALDQNLLSRITFELMSFFQRLNRIISGRCLESRCDILALSKDQQNHLTDIRYATLWMMLDGISQGRQNGITLVVKTCEIWAQALLDCGQNEDAYDAWVTAIEVADALCFYKSCHNVDMLRSTLERFTIFLDNGYHSSKVKFLLDKKVQVWKNTKLNSPYAQVSLLQLLMAAAFCYKTQDLFTESMKLAEYAIQGWESLYKEVSIQKEMAHALYCLAVISRADGKTETAFAAILEVIALRHDIFLYLGDSPDNSREQNSLGLAKALRYASTCLHELKPTGQVNSGADLEEKLSMAAEFEAKWLNWVEGDHAQQFGLLGDLASATLTTARFAVRVFFDVRPKVRLTPQETLVVNSNETTLWENAIEACHRAKARFETALKEGPSTAVVAGISNVYDLLADLELEYGNFNQFWTYAERAVDIFNEIPEADREKSAMYRHVVKRRILLGLAARLDPHVMLKLASKQVEMLQKINTEKPSDEARMSIIPALYTKLDCLHQIGDLPAGLDLLKEAQTLASQIPKSFWNTPEFSGLWFIENKIAMHYLYRQEFEKGLVAGEESCNTLKEMQIEDCLDLAQTLDTMAYCAFSLGQISLAQQYAEKSLEEYRNRCNHLVEVNDIVPQYYSEVLNTHASILASTGDFEAALRTVDNAFNILTAFLNVRPAYNRTCMPTRIRLLMTRSRAYRISEQSFRSFNSLLEAFNFWIVEFAWAPNECAYDLPNILDEFIRLFPLLDDRNRMSSELVDRLSVIAQEINSFQANYSKESSVTPLVDRLLLLLIALVCEFLVEC